MAICRAEEKFATRILPSQTITNFFCLRRVELRQLQMLRCVKHVLSKRSKKTLHEALK
jgi:hypothetical protein